MLMLLLFFTGLLSGTVDAIAGGGGLISIPVLLGMGLPPHVAFGTNKLQGAVGTLMAARRYARAGLVSLRSSYLGIFAGVLGAIAGSVVNQAISSDSLRLIAPFMLAIIFIYTILSPRLGHEDVSPKISSVLFYLTFGFALAFYDGFFGPGVGAFWVFLLMFFLGMNLIKATAYTKIFNLNSSLVAIVCFAVGSNIDYQVGIAMAAGQVLGGQLGATLAINKGAKLIRPLFLGMMFVTISSLAYRNYGAALLQRLPAGVSQIPYLPFALAVFLVAGVWLFRRLQQDNEQIIERK